MPISSADIQSFAHACGFEIAGVAAAVPHADFSRFQNWSQTGKAADLTYLTDHRAAKRADPKQLLSSARSIICLGKQYNTGSSASTETLDSSQGWISRYAWGLDYHDVLRPLLEKLLLMLEERHGRPFDSKICIDTAPLLERSYAKAAGLGWIGKNTCLINQEFGSWFFLAELLVSLDIAPSLPVPDRCGTCTRCIQACPTNAIVANPEGGFDVDAGLCISYLTIEKRDEVPSQTAARNGNHIFGCDICQDVCPWNYRAHRTQSGITSDESFVARIFAPDLAELAQLSEEEFQLRFRQTPIWRTKYAGFLRNVAIAMGNSKSPAMLEPLSKLALHHNPLVAKTASEALQHLEILHFVR